MVRRLMRTAARTAVISGTATSVAGRVARKQQRKFAEEDALHQRKAPSPAVKASAPPPDLVSRLQQLADLRSSGALSEKEFQVAKARLLAT
jgi:hypothetical protein